MAIKPKIIRSPLPNEGIEATFRRELDALIDEMHNSTNYWLIAAYRKTAPIFAEDASHVFIIQAAMNRLIRRWRKRFDDVAQEMAGKFTHGVKNHSEMTFAQAAKRAGMTISPFKMTKPMQTAYGAAISEQVGLIKSIPAQYLTSVQGEVMRAVQKGGDLGPLAKQLQADYGITKRRAALIARDQNAKATGILTRVRQIEIVGEDGEATWIHSGAGRHPRPDHVAAHGRTYKLSKGCLISGEYILPGELINCRCTSAVIIPGSK